jgi:hypothetical protein
MEYVSSAEAVKKTYLLAVACYLAIPFSVVGGLFVTANVDPEWAHRTAHYARDFHLLTVFKRALIICSVGLGGILWLLSCYCLVRSKRRSWRWLAFAFLGPLGIPFLAALRDDAPEPGDAYERFVQRLGRPAQITYELVFFIALWTAADLAIVLLRNILIMGESMATGAPFAQIVAQQSAMSGMYAFSEGLAATLLVPLVYLFRPIAFNLLAYLRRAAKPAA